MSDEKYESKRERQKARRAARLEQEAQVAVAADRKRTLTYGLIILLVVALIALLVFQQIQSRAADGEEAALATEMLGELGCTEDTRQPDLGGGHIAGDAASLAAESPDVIYPDQPDSSGRHIGSVVASGVYDISIDPRYTTHNMEHGYIVAWYSPDAPEAEVEELKAWGQEALDGDFPKVVVSEYYKPLPDGVNFSFTAWLFRQNCTEFDTAVANTFTRAHYDTNGEGPEKGIPAHNAGAQGVVDPDGQDTFLPPLDQELGTDSTLEDAQDAGNASAETTAGGDPTEASE